MRPCALLNCKALPYLIFPNSFKTPWFTLWTCISSQLVNCELFGAASLASENWKRRSCRAKKAEHSLSAAHTFPDSQNLMAVFFSPSTGIKLEELEDEGAMEKAWTSDEETIGVVFKDNFSYRLRFPISHVVIPNEVFGYIGNAK